MRRTVAGPPKSDQELASAAGEGDAASYAELYRRHLLAATGVALAITGNRDDAGDAVSEAFARVLKALPSAQPGSFRSYLMAATRHAAIDIIRQSGRVSPTDDLEALGTQSPDDGPAERILNSEDGALLSRAFDGLPERWRSVLWLLEVEGMPARDVAGELGLSPNNVAQIAVRGRARLRERYLQAHLGPDPAPACEFTTRRLGAYLSATLSRRDVAKADTHLDACPVCARRRDDLLSLGLKMRTLLPVPLGALPVLGARSRRPVVSSELPVVGTAVNPLAAHPAIALAPPDVQSGIAALRAALELGATQVMAASSAAPLVQRLVGGASVALLAIGASTLAVRTDVVGVGPSPAISSASASAGGWPPEGPPVVFGGALPDPSGGTVPGPSVGTGRNLLGIAGADPTPGAIPGPGGAQEGANTARLGILTVAGPALPDPAGPRIAVAPTTPASPVGGVGPGGVGPGGVGPGGVGPGGVGPEGVGPGGVGDPPAVPGVAGVDLASVASAVAPGSTTLGVAGLVPPLATAVAPAPVGEVVGAVVSAAPGVSTLLSAPLGGGPGLTPVAQVLHDPLAAATAPVGASSTVVGGVVAGVAPAGAATQPVAPLVDAVPPAAGAVSGTIGVAGAVAPAPVVPHSVAPVTETVTGAVTGTTPQLTPVVGVVPGLVPAGTLAPASIVSGIGL